MSAQVAGRPVRRAVVFLYAGQGAHYPAMGRALFECEPVFRDTLFRADRLLRRRTGVGLIDAVYGDSDDWLEDLGLSHPAIFAVEWAMTRALDAHGVRPDIVLGASLGEYVALAAAGCVGFDDMFERVVDQALVVREHVPAGGMLAVIGGASWLSRRPDLLAGVEVAARNFDGHVVLSGAPAALDGCRVALEAEGAICSRLPVAHAFHSAAVDGAREVFAARCAGLQLRAPRLPLASCAAVRVLERVDPAHLWRIVRDTVGFAETVRMLEAGGARHYVDVGPSGTLASFVVHLLGASVRERVSTPLSPAGGDLRGVVDALRLHAA